MFRSCEGFEINTLQAATLFQPAQCVLVPKTLLWKGQVPRQVNQSIKKGKASHLTKEVLFFHYCHYCAAKRGSLSSK